MSARRTPHPIPLVLAMVLAVLAATPIAPPVQGRSATEMLTADFDGKPIELTEVGTLHCHDFDHPRIHCFATQDALDAAAAPSLAAAGTSYLAIYENAYYGGAAMYVADDYTILATIGWNDRISSFRAVNSQAGTFYVDWFYGGSSYSFCCNQNAPYLGSFNDTFSSVRRS